LARAVKARHADLVMHHHHVPLALRVAHRGMGREAAR
jgi:hypothetical protein